MRHGHLLFLYEEDGTDGIEVDEGTITLGGSEAWPAYLTVGQMYVPFGVFESSMISDPFTLDVAETNQSALLIGYRNGGFHARGYGFNCDVDELGEDESEQIECYGLAAGYSRESEESLSFQVEAGYINSLIDTDGFEDYVSELNLESIDREGGYSIFTRLSYGAFTFIGEVVSGTGDLKFSTGTRETPLAWNTEFNYGLSLLGKDALVAVGYQATDNMAAILPKTRVLGSASVALIDGLSAGIEYAHDKDYKESEGGTNKSADTVTMQLGLEF